MNRFFFYSVVLSFAVIIAAGPAFARGVMRDQGAAGSLDQSYQTEIPLDGALSAPDAVFSRYNGDRSSGSDQPGTEAQDVD